MSDVPDRCVACNGPIADGEHFQFVYPDPEQVGRPGRVHVRKCAALVRAAGARPVVDRRHLSVVK
jgi:hypothetical protein